MIEPDPLDDAIEAFEKARQYETEIASGSAGSHGLGLQHRHRPAAPRHFASDRQAGEPTADDTDIHVEIEGQPRPTGRWDRLLGIPTRPAGVRIVRLHY